jgi:hypothetical protein
VFERRATGWLSQPVLTVSEMEKRYKDAVAEARDILARYGENTPEGRRQKDLIAKLDRAHDAYSTITGLQKYINAKRVSIRKARLLGNEGRVDQLESEIEALQDRMTRAALDGLISEK